MARRSAMQSALVALAIGGGLVLGTRLVAGRLMDETVPGPDIRLEHASLDDLAAAGYRFGANRPRTWSDIHLRQFQDQRGDCLILRARMAADEAASLISFPPDSRRPLDDAPPADWPRGAQDDPFALPAWFAPRGGQSRMFERGTADGVEGRFAVYEPVSGVMQVWMWRRADASLPRPAPTRVVADELAAALGDRLLRTADATTPEWLEGRAIPAADEFPAERLPATTLDACLRPAQGVHRYLIAVRDIARADALAIAGHHMPLRPLAADGAPPTVAWDFAVPPRGLPTWFAPGAGERWCHALIGIGTGTVTAGRWVAYDAAARALYVWDWEDSVARPAAADLAR